MDEVVLRAIAKWPNVPSVYGWLALDRRGNWSIKGERIFNRTIAEFIGRNYGCDEAGRWFFQNGPQRVYVTLAYTPLVYRTAIATDGRLALTAHTGAPAGAVTGAWIDEDGTLLAQAAPGIGLVHDQDLWEVLKRLVGPAGEAIDDVELEELLGQGATRAQRAARLQITGATLPLVRINSADVPLHFAFDPSPRPAAGEPEC